jgi:hypothetical protein
MPWPLYEVDSLLDYQSFLKEGELGLRTNQKRP